MRTVIARVTGAVLPGVVLTAMAIVLGALVVSAVGRMQASASPGPASPGAHARQAQGADPSAGEQVWTSSGCAGCHVLGGTGGSVGPNLDQEKPSFDHVVDVVSNGFGGMPAFGGQLSQQEIEDLAAYVVQQTAVVEPERLVAIGSVALKRTRRVVSVRVRCLPVARGLCAGSVKLRAKVKSRLIRRTSHTERLRTVALGKAIFTFDTGQRRAVKVRLNPTGRRLATRLGTRELRRLPVTVVASARDGSGLKRVTVKTAKLRVR